MNVQRGVFDNNLNNITDITISSVDVNKSRVKILSSYPSRTDGTSDHSVGYLQLLNSTTLRFVAPQLDWAVAGIYGTFTLVSWEVISEN